jgi:hypothetical protein
MFTVAQWLKTRLIILKSRVQISPLRPGANVIKFLAQNVSDNDNDHICFDYLGNVTKIGPTPFVFHCPRYPR